ncbi:MAG: ATP-binding cassette domain-containing protein [Alphaproteobacteria bacterium]|nr:ATP-binding cassette domain-containing protein [Alphaproteobacteria bacterium]MDP6518059.1 ATP-binding cassette domain-containing protein [Alphaproteobacteria bacterium]
MIELPRMIELHDVHLTLASAAGPVNILRGIDLEIAAGATVGVVGPSGSGKSTMIAAMAGLERATRGTIRIAGTDITALDEDRLARFRRDTIGIVFQAFHLIPTMTALENVAIPLELAGRDDALDSAGDSLAAVGLSARSGHYPSQLSGGEQQRVALARAVAARPKLLLADEPTGNLDQETGQRVIDLMFRIQDEAGATFVLITHDPALAGRCQRILRIVDGRIDGGGGP